MKAVEIYHAIQEMQERDYSESEIINGINMILKDQQFLII